ncbi:unnamed protein product [Rhizophagus irregularis]|nr:unnamed protein product [Rhizophagus irregularis]
MDEKPKKLWKYDDNYQYHVTIPTIDSENVDERVVYIGDLKKRKQASDTSYTDQSTSANLISECLDVQLSELDLNEICQDEEDNIE